VRAGNACRQGCILSFPSADQTPPSGLRRFASPPFCQFFFPPVVPGFSDPCFSVHKESRLFPPRHRFFLLCLRASMVLLSFGLWCTSSLSTLFHPSGSISYEPGEAPSFVPSSPRQFPPYPKTVCVSLLLQYKVEISHFSRS